MMRFLHAGRLHPALHLFCMVCLFIGMLSFVASGILYVRKVSYRRDARTLASMELERHSSCGKRALIALSFVLALLLIKGISHGGLHLPMHIPGFRQHFHSRHGSNEWQYFSDSDMEGEGDDNEGFKADKRSDYAEHEEGESDDGEEPEAADNSDRAEDQEGEGYDTEGFESDDGADDQDEGEARQQRGLQSTEQKQTVHRKKVTAINDWKQEPMARKKIKMSTKMRMTRTMKTRRAQAVSRTRVMV